MSNSKIAEQAQEILEQLKIDQIKYIYRKLGLTPSSKDKKEDLIESLLTRGKNLKSIRSEACLIAAETPTKHVFIAKVDTQKTKIHTKSREIFKSTILKEFEVLSEDFSDGILRVSCQHNISTIKWVSEGKDLKRKKKVSFNHLTFLSVDTKKSLITISYNGFENHISSRDKNYISYQAIVDELLNKLASDYGIGHHPLPVRSTIEFLVESNSSRVARQKLNPDFGMGKMTISAKPGYDVETLIAKALGAENDLSAKKKVVENLKNTSIEYFVTHWKDENLISRIEFWPNGSEFLFIWRGGQPTLSAYKKIFDFIMDCSDKNVPANKVLTFVAAKEAGSIIKVSDVTSTIGISQDKAAGELTECLTLGLLDLVYRVKSNIDLCDYLNDWTHDLMSLRKIFTDTSGNQIDGRIPQNIEVAFQRPFITEVKFQQVNKDMEVI